MSKVNLAIFLAVLLINLVSFAAYGIDKRKARKGKWRTKEAALLLLAFLGGALGALLGMRIFHHKTKHRKFKILVPVFLMMQIAIAVYLSYLKMK